MFDYFHKFDKLKPELKRIVSSPEAVKIIEGIEKDFNVDLASLVMRVMVKEVSIESLPLRIFTEFSLEQKKSEELAEKLKEKVFYSASDYLGFSLNKPQEKKEESKKSFGPLVLEIYEKIGVKFSQEKKIVFFSLIDKYIRGLKSRFSVRSVLTEDIDAGGLGLSDKLVDDIFEIVQKSQDQVRERVKKELPVKKEVLNKIEKLSHGKKLLETEKKVYELAPLHPVLLEKESPKRIEKPESKERIKKIEEKKEEIKKKEEPRPMITKKKTSFSNNGAKVKMDDVKRVKITGPIDELRYMDLTNLRRLSDDPVKAFEKISQKLKVLEDIDYTKMLEGINAWRQSPVYKMYLNIFFKASNEGLKVKELIERLKSSDKKYLNQEEIDALIDFNKRLNF
jgi:hypothetical protein